MAEKEKKKLHRRIIEKTRLFGSEFRKQTGTAIITAFGLIVALSWKDVITNIVNDIYPTTSGSLLSALIVTAIAVLGIILVNKWINKAKEN